MTIVKFCGLRCVEDASAAVEAGCDLIGLNFVAHSRRHISTKLAVEIVDSLKARTQFVGVFMDAGLDEVASVLEFVKLDYVQFHGSEHPEYCESFGLPYIKSFAMQKRFEFEAHREIHPKAFAFLLDTHSESGGGSGKKFDWSLAPRSPQYKVFLAGGLTPANVATAVSQIRPWAVDVASGIENLNGFKDVNKMDRFMRAVRSV